jgi:hypothetical protein
LFFLSSSICFVSAVSPNFYDTHYILVVDQLLPSHCRVTVVVYLYSPGTKSQKICHSSGDRPAGGCDAF